MSQAKTSDAPSTPATETSSTAERLRQQGEHLRRRGEELRREVKDVRDDVQRVAETAKATANDLQSMLTEHITEQPYLVLGGAFATGWLLGTVVPGWLVRFVFGVGRRATGLALTQQLVARTLSHTP